MKPLKLKPVFKDYIWGREKLRTIYKKETDLSPVAESVKENRVVALLNSVLSKKGAVFLVEAGTIHAIGKCNIICEIQQNSNVTYRSYDY